MLTPAAAKKPVPLLPGMLTMPSLVGVTPMATMSGDGVGDADNMKVLRPITLTVTGVLEQAKTTPISAALRYWLGVSPNTYPCAACGAMFTGVLGLPVN